MEPHLAAKLFRQFLSGYRDNLIAHFEENLASKEKELNWQQGRFKTVQHEYDKAKGKHDIWEKRYERSQFKFLKTILHMEEERSRKKYEEAKKKFNLAQYGLENSKKEFEEARKGIEEVRDSDVYKQLKEKFIYFIDEFKKLEMATDVTEEDVTALLARAEQELLPYNASLNKFVFLQRVQDLDVNQLPKLETPNSSHETPPFPYEELNDRLKALQEQCQEKGIQNVLHDHDPQIKELETMFTHLKKMGIDGVLEKQGKLVQAQKWKVRTDEKPMDDSEEEIFQNLQKAKKLLGNLLEEVKFFTFSIKDNISTYQSLSKIFSDNANAIKNRLDPPQEEKSSIHSGFN